METILLAGGTGLIGKELSLKLKNEGYNVRILSRQKSNYTKGFYNWDPYKSYIDPEALKNVDIIINLVGEGIADKKWTNERKKALIDSRVIPTNFLYESFKNTTSLKQYISASGINCYGYDNYDKKYTEEDMFGNDFLSQVVEKWENAANQFKNICLVSKLRISVVLTPHGGAFPKIAQPIKLYAGATLGTGKQWMPWISMEDLLRMFIFVAQNKLEGTFNALANTDTNKKFTQELAFFLKKPLFLPNVPAFILRLFLGEMSTVILEGLQASNDKIKNKGFTFKHNNLQDAFKNLGKF
jgi:uncharacterized protein (TIGR01777 family)